ncbi:MAG TPA: hypothetical protein VNZ06_00785 [Steroidobacteraceae bacterium]|nr:hypothetical protein [Steroidobacteraceae bacterium]
MRSLCKPLCVIALLLCKLAQAALVPIPTELNTCPRHSMQQRMVGSESMPHASCCKFSGCDCLQAPALAGPGLSAAVFAGTADCASVLHSDQPRRLAGWFFRPPIA